jgi:hypothetical protein
MRFFELNFGRNLVQKHGGSIVTMLKMHYPNLKVNMDSWNLGNWSHSHKYIHTVLVNLLPNNVEVERDSGLSFLKYFITKKTMDFDIWIPSFNLAIEYQVHLISYERNELLF